MTVPRRTSLLILTVVVWLGCEKSVDGRLPACGFDNPAEIEWIYIEGGEFLMGDNSDPITSPQHHVSVPPFFMAKTETSLVQWERCPDSDCDAVFDRRDPAYCEMENLDNHPEDLECVITTDAHPVFVSFAEAKRFGLWAGGELPTEAQWEYAARSQGMDVTYPWGEAPPSCELGAFFTMAGVPVGCRGAFGSPACSRPAGNTEQGLCDMAGNVSEWTEDVGHSSYEGAPDDGSAWTENGDIMHTQGFDVLPETVRVVRSGPDIALVTSRGFLDTTTITGFRLVRAAPERCDPTR